MISTNNYICFVIIKTQKLGDCNLGPTLNTFRQLQGEAFFMYFERFKDLLIECPHYEFEKIRLIQMLYDGLDYPTKTIIESLCNGGFIGKTANDA